MSSIITFLTDIGLSATEANIYVAGLKQPVTANNLAEKLIIKRSTVYHALSTLENKGLAVKRRDSGRLYYHMTPAESLQGYIAEKNRQLEQQQIVLEKILPLFPSSSEISDTYAIERHESLAGVKKVLDKALHCKDPQWRIIAPRQNFLSEYDKEYAAYYLSKRRTHKIKAKTLWEAPQQNAQKGALNVGEIFMRSPRYLPSKYHGTFKSVIILFDDSIAFISSLKRTEALLVTSEEFSATMAVLFDALWEQSEEFLK